MNLWFGRGCENFRVFSSICFVAATVWSLVLVQAFSASFCPTVNPEVSRPTVTKNASRIVATSQNTILIGRMPPPGPSGNFCLMIAANA